MTNRPQWLEIDHFVEAYETAQVRDARAELREFLPPPDHPSYLAIQIELVRVDLELSWRRGARRSLEHYRPTLPDLFQQPDALRLIAFEHYRLAKDHGLFPAREDYHRQFGIDTSDWPALSQLADVAASEHSLPRTRIIPGAAGGMHEASVIYERFRQAAPDDFVAPKELWESHHIDEDVADLFRELHQSDPRVAHHLARATTSMPKAGDAFLDFLLLAELGRGAFGRVFLARQATLADRLVVLKLSTDLRGESRTLAKLQHTNIVPIYSAYHVRPFQAVCMPYFGATTLADVLRDLRGFQGLPASGKQLISTIQGNHPNTIEGPLEPPVAHIDLPGTSATESLDKLEKASYIDAVLWLGARLADGLAHAHARGIYHHDLKPANVLLADDGQPMLLDFNLAEDTKLSRSAAAVRVGGTLPYMAPEQLERFQGGIGQADGRGDIYSLGLILYELLTGRHPSRHQRGR